MLKGVSTRVVLLLLGIMLVSLLVSFKMNERFGSMHSHNEKEGFETKPEVQSTEAPVVETNTKSSPEPEPEPAPVALENTASAPAPAIMENNVPNAEVTRDVQVKPPTTSDPVPANKPVNTMSQRLGLTSEDKTHLQSIITKVFANAGTFAAEKLGHMMEGFESRSSIPSSRYM